MPAYPAVTESFSKLQAWLMEHTIGITFRNPVIPAALDNFSTKSGLNLPEDLRQILLIADGETPKSAGAIGNWRMMNIAEIQAAWGLLNHLAVKGAFADLVPEPSPYMRQAWWHPAWIPIVTSDAGDFFCIDTDPPEPERSGQVLLFLHDQPTRPLVAAGLTAWLDRIVRDLIEGIYSFDPDTGFHGEAFLWSSLEGKHLLDGIEGKLVV